MGLERDTTFTWYGHACVEVRTPAGRTILIDPWFGNPKSPRAADDVDACDVLLVTHGHSDHIGDAVGLARRLRPAWPAIHELSLWASQACPEAADGIVGMNKGGTVDAGGVRVTMTQADHSAGNWDDDSETTVYLGEPAGFVVELENGFRFYHAGDTNVFADMALIRDLHRPELAFLPIGGHYTMDPRAAALAVELLGVAHVVPIHYGTFELLSGTPDELRAEIAARGLSCEVHALEVGGSLA